MSAKRLGKDIISSVPDEILGKILSLLPTKLAASTSVLSKRWRNLVAHVDKLDFDDASGGPRGFPEFVEKTLAYFSNSRTIKRFSLTLTDCTEYEKSRVNSWVRTALDWGCSELHLEYVGMDRLETEFFTSNKLVELTIRDLLYPHRLHESVIFPALKTLSLISLGFSSEDMYEELISGCPVLENLSLHYSEDSHPPNWSGVLSSPSIKQLTIFHNYPSFREAHDDILLETPSLVFLDYSGYIADRYEVCLDSLVEARLDLRSWEQLIDEDENDEDGDITDLVAGISNIKTLHLSPDSLEVFHFCCKSMPVFHNLLKLSFESHTERGWQVLPLLLNNSPNLKTLVIEGLAHQITDRCGDACPCIRKKKKTTEQVCCLSTCQVKVLTISGYRGTCRDLKQMRHFFGNLKCLETIKVGVKLNHQQDNNAFSNNYLRITNALIKLPRVSSHCRIHFF